MRPALVSDLSVSQLRNLLCALLAGCALFSVCRVGAAEGQYIANNTPRFVATAKKLGPVDLSETLELSIWLQLHNRSALDKLAQELYDPKSPEYRHWLKSTEVATQFAPSAADMSVVKAFLAANGLDVLTIGPNNFYVRARGTVADIEKAFRVELNNYQVADTTLRSNASDPFVAGPAGALIQAVSGLDNSTFTHPAVLQPAGVPTSGPAVSGRRELAGAALAFDADGFQADCFPGREAEHHTTFGNYPKATYTGNRYVSGAAGCGYAPADIQAAYHLDSVYAEGYDGKGQTIVLIEACGSPTILNDANVFSQRFGLPKLSTSNFRSISLRPSTCEGYYPNINADLEWAHAIAPGAAIDMLVAPTGLPEDLDEAIFYAVSYGLGNVISDDNSAPEFFVAQTELEKESLISEIAAVEGIATNYAVGEAPPIPFAFLFVTAPADGPYGTGIGGISLALSADSSIAFQTAWQTHFSFVLYQGQIADPAIHPFSMPITGYLFGSTGGPSAFFAKPSFQKSVPGNYRQEPDISWLADPYTGGVIVVTQPVEPPQVWTVDGGTELATPMFSALWAIANQRAGVALGQAAPYLYSMPSTTIKDIVPYSSPDNVVATVQESSSSTQQFNAGATLLVQEPLLGPFYSAMWDNPLGEEDTVMVLSFGQDYFIKPRVGWDVASGLGAPADAKAFVDWFAPAPGSQN